jgi:serine protease Do
MNISLLSSCVIKKYYTTTTNVTENTTPNITKLVNEVIDGVVRVKSVRIAPNGQKMGATGTGYVFNLAEGFVLTNRHVIEDSDEVFVIQGKTVFKAEVVFIPEDLDAAVLKIIGLNVIPHKLKELKLGNSDKVVVGERVVVIGHPYGLENTVTFGIVSAIRENVIQTDADINPGNSGGPMFNMNREIVGMNTWMVSVIRGSIGLNFSIQINTIKKAIAPFLKEYYLEKERNTGTGTTTTKK